MPKDSVSRGERERPESSAEKEEFSSGGNRHLILLRGPTGLAIDKVILRATGYSLMTKQYAVANGVSYTPTLLITTIGARSHRLRTAALPYFRVGEDLVLRGSNGGGPTDPHWVHNIRKNSDAWVRIGWKTRPVHAHVSSGEERERIFKELSRLSASTEAYQNMCAPRELPLVVLRPWSRVES